MMFDFVKKMFRSKNTKAKPLPVRSASSTQEKAKPDDSFNLYPNDSILLQSAFAANVHRHSEHPVTPDKSTTECEAPKEDMASHSNHSSYDHSDYSSSSSSSSDSSSSCLSD